MAPFIILGNIFLSNTLTVIAAGFSLPIPLSQSVCVCVCVRVCVCVCPVYGKIWLTFLSWRHSKKGDSAQPQRGEERKGDSGRASPPFPHKRATNWLCALAKRRRQIRKTNHTWRRKEISTPPPASPNKSPKFQPMMSFKMKYEEKWKKNTRSKRNFKNN